MKKYIFIYILFYFVQSVSAQDSITINKNNALEKFDFHFFVDTYFAYDFHSMKDSASKARLFATNSMYNDEFRLNIAMLSIDYDSDKLFSSLALQFGDIPQLLTPINKQFIKYIKRGYFGYRLDKETFVKFGYMPSYIGYESSLPAKNSLGSVSVAGYFEPSDFIGIELGRNFTNKLSGSLYCFNAYNVISKNNDNKAVGLSINYKPYKELNLYYANSFGNESTVDYKQQWLFYNEFYLKYSIWKIEMVGLIDFALQTNSKSSDTTAIAYMNTGMIQLKYHAFSFLDVTMRGEWFFDPDAFISEGAGNSGDHLSLNGLAVGFGFHPMKNIYFKGEYDFLSSDQEVFQNNSKQRNSIVITTGVTL
jgi:hypothetical protein